MTLIGEQQPPPPPQGPGVFPPFPAPPVEGRGRRLGIGLGLGAGALVLVCGGGLAAFAGLTTVMGNALNEQAQVAVTDYLEALRARDYPAAYDELCDERRDEQTEGEFVAEVADDPPIRSYRVGKVEFVDASVPVTVTYNDGETAELRAYLGASTEAAGFRVCRIEE